MPVTSFFTWYSLAAYTNDVVRLWLLDLFNRLYSFGLDSGRWCSSRHSRFYYPVSSSGLTAGVSCEKYREIGDGFRSLSCRFGTRDLLGSPRCSDWVQFCPGCNVSHYSHGDHVRYALLPCVSLVRPPTPPALNFYLPNTTVWVCL